MHTESEASKTLSTERHVLRTSNCSPESYDHLESGKQDIVTIYTLLLMQKLNESLDRRVIVGEHVHPPPEPQLFRKKEGPIDGRS